ncbi:MAG: hypothetical protein JW982_15285, partial [Spirochaetes bacterium]|nr:hypothetical protein [Spirochaetota bacterium]
LLFSVLIIFTACESIPKPQNSRVGVLMGYMETYIDQEFGLVRKGSYMNNVMLRLENVDTKEAKFAFTQNGFFTYHNLMPGVYKIVNWKYYFSGAGESYTWFHVYFDKPIVVEIKPGTVTMISKFKSVAELTREKNWNYPFYQLPTTKAEMEKEFSEDPKNKFWQDFQKEFVVLSDKK